MSVSPKEVIRRLYKEVWNERNFDLIDQLVSQSHGLVAPNVSGAAVGPAAYKRQIASLVAGFPDLRFVVDEIVSENEKSWRPGPLRELNEVNTWGSRQPTKRFRSRESLFTRSRAGKFWIPRLPGIPLGCCASWALSCLVNSKDAPYLRREPGQRFSFPNLLFFAQRNLHARLPANLYS